MPIGNYESLEGGHFTPLDLWIALALISSDSDKAKLHNVVAAGINNLDYQIAHMPERWTQKRHSARVDRNHFVVILDKLQEMCDAMDKIPF